MIAVLKPGTTNEQLDHLIQWLKRMDLDVHCSTGQQITVLGLIGDTNRVDMELLAPMVLVPPRFDDAELLHNVKELLCPCGFGTYSVTSAQEHDRMIAFTSQMPHILSNAFIKSPTAGTHKGFSAGSYKDLTRVAWLNPYMWAELFMANKENVLNELEIYIENLLAYKNAIQNDDHQYLIQLLDAGRKRKEEVDG